MCVHTFVIHICAHQSRSSLEDRRSGSPTDKPACRVSTQPLNLDHWNIDHTHTICLIVYTHTHTMTLILFIMRGCRGIWMEGGMKGGWIWTWMGLQMITELEEVMHWTPLPPKISQSPPQQAKLILLGLSWSLLTYIWMLKCFYV